MFAKPDNLKSQEGLWGTTVLLFFAGRIDAGPFTSHPPGSRSLRFRASLRARRVNGIHQPEVIVCEQKAVRSSAQDAAGASMHHTFPLLCGEETGNEIPWLTIDRRKLDHPIPCADVRVTGAMERYEEGSTKDRITSIEVLEPERRTVRCKSCVGRNN